MRSRNLKPGFFANDILAMCSWPARLLFAGLWLLADREGLLEDRPLWIKGQLFPFDNIDVDALLSELAGKGFVERYSRDGRKCLWIPKFTQHQRIHPNEAQSVLPEPPGNVPSESGNGVSQNALVSSCLNASCLNEELLNAPSSKEMSAEADDTLAGVQVWIAWWNDLKREGVVAAGVSREPVSNAVKRGWTRVCKSKELRKLLSDRDVLAGEIGTCPFLREGWFTLEKLLGGKNRDGVYIVQRILDGGYRDSTGACRSGQRSELDPSIWSKKDERS